MPVMPTLTLITPCLNRAGFIAEAIDSVVDQQGVGEIEHIVVDGGSTDGTLDVLARYPHLTVISEPDDGVYDAVNKGLAVARGEVVGWLNSDDRYAPGALARVLERFAADPDLELVSGGATVFRNRDDGSEVRTADFPGAVFGPLTVHQATVGVPIINARFYRRSLLERVGRFDIAYPIASDREFLLRMAMDDPRAAVLDACLYHYREHPGSLTIVFHNPYKARTVDDCMGIAERYAARADMSPEVRKICRYWHAKESVDGLANGIRNLHVGNIARFALRGWRHTPWWPLWLVWFVAGKIRRHTVRFLGG